MWTTTKNHSVQAYSSYFCISRFWHISNVKYIGRHGTRWYSRWYTICQQQHYRIRAKSAEWATGMRRKRKQQETIYHITFRNFLHMYSSKVVIKRCMIFSCVFVLPLSARPEIISVVTWTENINYCIHFIICLRVRMKVEWGYSAVGRR